ncbi:hypothetical protein A6A10_05410 [Otariodibacter oris]|nr:hypothetical protein A6A10_05410 [Otariodibacter oris]
MTEFFNSAEQEAGDLTFDYAKLSDAEAEQDFRPNTVEDKGFFILPSQLFENVVKTAKENENLNTDLANIFKSIEASAVGFPSENDIKGLFEDVDTTSNRLGGTVAEKNQCLCFEALEQNKEDSISDFSNGGFKLTFKPNCDVWITTLELDARSLTNDNSFTLKLPADRKTLFEFAYTLRLEEAKIISLKKY